MLNILVINYNFYLTILYDGKYHNYRIPFGCLLLGLASQNVGKEFLPAYTFQDKGDMYDNNWIHILGFLWMTIVC